MSREIKFRAWNSEARTMHHSIPTEAQGQDLNHIFEFIASVSELTLMQYTGLKDHNGVEIYEGDIQGLNGKSFYTVIWNAKEAMFNLADLGGKPVHDFDFGSYEVIGNIWENKDLLDERS